MQIVDFAVPAEHICCPGRTQIVDSAVPAEQIVDFAVPAEHRINLKECEKKDKYLDLARELKMKVTIVPIVIGALGTITKGLLKGLEDLEVGGRVETPNDSIAKNGQNPETSPRDLRRLAVTQTPVKNYQLTL